MTTVQIPVNATHPHTAPSSDPAAPRKLHFSASRATRQANKALTRADALIAGNGGVRYASPEQALSATLAVPQYRRTYVQGCACATGIAGGGCCPGNAMGTAAGAGTSGAPGAMVPVDLAITGLGIYGMYSGYTVARNASNALQHLRRVETASAHALDGARLWQAKIAGHAPLVQTAAAAQKAARTLSAEQRDLKVSVAEQKFNFAVPGLTQLAAATTAVVASVGHLANGCLGAVGGAAVGSCASALFALYGGAFAVKNLAEYHAARKMSGIALGEHITGDGAVDVRFAGAVNEHLQQTRRNKLLTGIAWSAVCAAGILGTLVAAGAVAFAGAVPVVVAVSLAAGAWAMWQNSQTRYVPHLPLSPHTDRAFINTSRGRALTWQYLSRQDAAIKQAVTQMNAVQTNSEMMKYHLQRLFRPQCGPKAFTVLGKSVQDLRGKTDKVDGGRLRPYYERVQLEAAKTWCENERALLKARFEDQSEELWLRCDELRALTSPCCAPMTATAEAALQAGAPEERVYSEAAGDLARESGELETAATKLMALDTLSATLRKLTNDAGDLATATGDAPWTSAQRQWAFARVQLLQLSGALSDAVSKTFIGEHPEFFSTLSPPAALPVGNVHVLQNQVAAFTKAIAPELDGAFVHAFFNPKRIEGEMDFIIERELTQRHEAARQAALATREQEPATVAPACDGTTCCR